MDSLEKYFGKNIKVIFIDNQIEFGNVNDFTSIYDSEDGQEWLTIETKKYPCMTFNQSEIKSIEIID